MADFNDIYEEIKDKSVALIKDSVSKYKERAEEEVKQFLEDSKDSIKLWTQQKVDGKITTQEYEYLVFGLKDIAELKILKNAGLAQQRVGQLIGSILNIIVDVALKALG